MHPIGNAQPDSDRDDGGAIGIGAMIVFIALVLVAAVASSVIIGVAENLQQNAQNTGEDTRDEIGGKIVILSAITTALDVNDDYKLTITFETSPGSETITLADIVIQITCTAADGGFIKGVASLYEHIDDGTNATTATDGSAMATISAGQQGVIVTDLYDDFGTTAGVTTNNDGCKIAQGFQHTMYVHVPNGGSTFETLKYTSGTLGEVVT